MGLADERAAQAREACRPRVVVIGDAFVDEYVYADRVRLNPEAPTLCVTTGKRPASRADGGAANVWHNVWEMLRGVAQVDGIMPQPQREWPVKRRYVVDGAVVFRADENDRCNPIDPERVRRACAGATAIVVADYGKGAVTDQVWRAVADAGVPVFAHTKDDPNYICVPREALARFTWFVNSYEFAAHWQSYGDLGDSTSAVVVTRGIDGAGHNSNDERRSVPAFPANVVDVCGAGDSFMAAYVAAWVRGERDVERLLRAGCAAGAAAVERFGTSVVSWDDVMLRLLPKRAAEIERAAFQAFGMGFTTNEPKYATREEYDAQDGVDWDEVFDEVLL